MNLTSMARETIALIDHQRKEFFPKFEYDINGKPVCHAHYPRRVPPALRKEYDKNMERRILVENTYAEWMK